MVVYTLEGGEEASSSSLKLKQSHETKVRLSDLTRTAKDDADRTGMVTVWPSEEALAFLCVKRKDLFKGKNVIEIGSGLGLAGLAIAATSEAKSVVITDGNSDTVERLRSVRPPVTSSSPHLFERRASSSDAPR